jgi:hypothetical protein
VNFPLALTVILLIHSSQTCWRAELVKLLDADGLTNKYHFVGTQKSSCTGIGSNGGHEGYPAYKATTSARGPKGSFGGIGGEWDDEKNNLLPKVLAKNQPDIVLILLGINDMVTTRRFPAKAA